jgi:hypothetical protein
MTNSYFNYLEKDYNGGSFFDFFTIADIPDKYETESYFYDYEVSDDVRLESISFDVYGDVNFWDTIVLVNGMISVDELPKNQTYINTIIEEKVQNYYTKFNIDEKTTKEQYTILNPTINGIAFLDYPIVPVLEGDDTQDTVISDLVGTKKLEIYNDISDSIQENNEKYRSIKVIIPTEVYEFRRLLDLQLKK